MLQSTYISTHCQQAFEPIPAGNIVDIARAAAIGRPNDYSVLDDNFSIRRPTSSFSLTVRVSFSTIKKGMKRWR
jgi:hypothetical protein